MAFEISKFVIKWVADNSDLLKGAKQAEQAGKTAEKSLNSSTNSSEKFSKSLGGVARRIAEVAAGAISLGAILANINSAANYADKLNDISKALGVNVESLDAWGRAAKISGGSIEGFQGSLSSLVDELRVFSVTGQSKVAPVFRHLGVALKDSSGSIKNAFQLLPELANAFKSISNEKAMHLGQLLGFDVSTIQLLQKGSYEIERIISRQKELGLVTKRDAEIAGKFNDAWDDTAYAFRGLFLQIGSGVLPTITKLLNGTQNFITFLRGNSEFVTGFFISLTTLITIRLIPSLIRLGVVATAAFAPFLAVYGPIIAISAAIGALAVDIAKFNAGEKSFIGGLSSLEGSDRIGHGRPSDKIQAALNRGGSFLAEESYFGNIDKGKNALQLAGSAPISAQTSNSIANANTYNRSNSSTVNTGNITIQTQATNSTDIAREFKKSLNNVLRQTQSTYDDGVNA